VRSVGRIVAEQPSISIPTRHRTELESGSKRNCDGYANEHGLTHINCDGYANEHGLTHINSDGYANEHGLTHINSDGYPGYRWGWGFVPAHGRQCFTDTRAISASRAANQSTHSADHTTHAGCVSIHRTDAIAHAFRVQRDASGHAGNIDGPPDGTVHYSTCDGHTRSHRQSVDLDSPSNQ
jgi:hypothetical protein